MKDIDVKKIENQFDVNKTELSVPKTTKDIQPEYRMPPFYHSFNFFNPDHLDYPDCLDYNSAYDTYERKACKSPTQYQDANQIKMKTNNPQS